MKPSRRALACLAACLVAGGPAAAQAPAPRSLADLSLEQLANIEVTSVGKRVQRLADVPGSVYVVTQEDIRRSGATTLAEALRLAANLQVARADANQYAITARGFNSVLANKMLVLVDGRTVYSPLFSGVFWEVQDLVVEDIERIEVLSGASGTLYGSNAVNGVINVITRSAVETQGVLAKAGYGRDERLAAARYGGFAGGFHYRLHAKRRLHDASERAGGAPVRDASQHSRVGFRADRVDGASQLTLQGDLYDSRIDQVPAARQVSGGHLLGRYVRDMGPAGRLQLQGYVDRAERDQPGAVRDTLDTLDVEAQHQLQPRTGHELLWGAGARLQKDRVTNLAPAVLALLPAQRDLHLWNVFVQDEVALRDRLHVTVGLKAEHNAYTGLEWLPNARLAWELAPNTLLWSAVSRAVRAPARIDREFFSPAVGGGAGFQSEIAKVLEVGLRARPLPRVAWSATLFHHRFERLRSLDAGPGAPTLNNSYEARLSGFETWGEWRVSERWRIDAGYAWQKLRAAAVPGSSPVLGVSSLGNDPRYRFVLASAWDVTPQLEFDLHLRRTGALPSPAVPAYTALDLRWGWHARPGLELSLQLRNLLAGRHPEWGTPATRTELGRSWMLEATWRM